MISHNRVFRGTALTGAVLFAAALIGCTANPTDPGLQPEHVVQESVGAGLIQTVRITPTRPAPGDTITVHSVVHKRTGTAVTVQSRTCDLDLEGNLDLRDPFGRCAGYSMERTLAPGDSVVTGTQRVVESGSGSYTLRVRHLVSPEVWLSVQVEVAAR